MLKTTELKDLSIGDKVVDLDFFKEMVVVDFRPDGEWHVPPDSVQPWVPGTLSD